MSKQSRCKHFISAISGYIDGDVEGQLCEELEKHLQHCNNCQIVINTMKKTIELYQRTTKEERLSETAKAELFVRLNLTDYIGK